MNICIFCASAAPHTPQLAEDILRLVSTLAAHGHTIVSGGMGGAGTMNLVGAATLNAGGQLLTIYPPEDTAHSTQSHPSLTHLHTQSRTLHDRHEKMTAHADCFLVLPGGIRTLHEALQAWADIRMGYHTKPLHFFNAEGFFNPLLTFLEDTVKHGYTTPALARMATFHPTVESLTATLCR
jgi:uncharacterized protein (TIGR00730 family)